MGANIHPAMLPAFRQPYNWLMAHGFVWLAHLISRWIAPIVEEIILWMNIISGEEWIENHHYKGKDQVWIRSFYTHSRRLGLLGRILLHRRNNIRFEETGKGALAMEGEIGGVEAFRSNAEWFSKVIEAAAEGVFVIDRERRYVALNSASERYVGKQPQSCLGKTLFEVFPVEMAEAFSAQIRNGVCIRRSAIGLSNDQSGANRFGPESEFKPDKE